MDPDPIEILRNRTVVPKNAKEHEWKIKLHKEALKKDPNNSDLLTDMGNEYLRLGKYELAIKCHNKALKLNPDKFYYKFNKGTAYLLSDKFHNAAECYEEALMMNPTEPNILMLKKVATMKIIEKTPSIYDTDKAREDLSKHSEIAVDWFNRGMDNMNNRNYEEALDCFDEALRIDNKFALVLLQKEQIFCFRQEFREAIRYFNEIIELNLDQPSMMLELWVNKGICHRRIGEEENALKCYRKALEINPNDFDTWLNMGNVLTDLNRYDDALECLNSAIKLADEANYESAKMRCNKGLVLGKLRRYNEAIEIIDEALEINPVYFPSWLARGLALKGLNKPRKAIECFDEVLRIKPNISLAIYEKANLLYDLGENREALKCFNILSRLDPTLISNDHEKIQLIRKLNGTEKPQMKYCGKCGMKLKENERFCFNCGSSIKIHKLKEEGSLDQNFSEWSQKGLASIKNKEYANAILYFNKCLDIDLNDAEVWVSIAIAYLYLKRSEYAELCLNKSLQLNPNIPEALILKEKIGYPPFSKSGLSELIGNPIKGLKVEGNNIKDKCTRALKIFRPYLMLNNSVLEIEDIQKSQIRLKITGDLRLKITGDLGDPRSPIGPLYADIQSFLYNFEPPLNVVFVKFWK